MTKYIKENWPEYQEFMRHPDFYEKCFFCSEDNSYFISEDLYDEVMNKLEFPKKYENTELGTIVCYENYAIVNGTDYYWYDTNNMKKGNVALVYNHDTNEWIITRVKALTANMPILFEDSSLMEGINCELIGYYDLDKPF